MRKVSPASPTSLQIDFVQDTLFGPVAHSAECEVQLAPLNINGLPGLRLQVRAPVPAKLERSHSVAFVWEGRTYRGIVQYHRRCDDGGLQLQLELQ
ncbi:hypothetical protein ACIOVF_13920 [Pseudomonas sp. NPDC087612]|uniref:PilZ domain-containing protein n=1 Tax=Pseudomonas vranovensis TaxID=321661 RepID=A0A423D023_9PSED|nr:MULTISPECIES: hypothetical protein [Pseudomonas]KJK18092.1 hypothetical protein UB48_10880 [Pseudomonas sp. 2(2015)]NLU60208.1 hypothetical protein [Pseudomonas sp. BIGb0427]QPG61581.1 hypothetical protein HFV04_018900 [Pseudomonas sp. BIGb0427]QVM94607.1 hypothetical protein JYG36_15900 [Pseudomonas sp. SORT22]ROL64901.1 hypothetical protein BHU25_23830 [Pseudomonas vranovensis]